MNKPRYPHHPSKIPYPAPTYRLKISDPIKTSPPPNPIRAPIPAPIAPNNNFLLFPCNSITSRDVTNPLRRPHHFPLLHSHVYTHARRSQLTAPGSEMHRIIIAIFPPSRARKAAERENPLGQQKLPRAAFHRCGVKEREKEDIRRVYTKDGGITSQWRWRGEIQFSRRRTGED